MRQHRVVHQMFDRLYQRIFHLNAGYIKLLLKQICQEILDVDQLVYHDRYLGSLPSNLPKVLLRYGSHDRLLPHPLNYQESLRLSDVMPAHRYHQYTFPAVYELVLTLPAPQYQTHHMYRQSLQIIGRSP